jgi:hypothetical protein
MNADVPIAECGFRIADSKKKNPLAFQSAIRNPKSAIGSFLTAAIPQLDQFIKR